MRIEIGTQEVFVHTISDEDYNESILPKKNMPKSRAYRRSRHLLEQMNLKFPLKEYQYSISHTKTLSAIAFSINPYLGIDIEPRNRKLGANITKKLKEKSKRLFISEIELWCIMESTFKSKRLEHGENFLEYDFYVEDKIFFHNASEGLIATNIKKVEGLIMSVSLLI